MLIKFDNINLVNMVVEEGADLNDPVLVVAKLIREEKMVSLAVDYLSFVGGVARKKVEEFGQSLSLLLTAELTEYHIKNEVPLFSFIINADNNIQFECLYTQFIDNIPNMLDDVERMARYIDADLLEMAQKKLEQQHEQSQAVLH